MKKRRTGKYTQKKEQLMFKQAMIKVSSRIGKVYKHTCRTAEDL